MKILFTRHGPTDWNKLHKLQGRADIELNESGIQNAYDAKEELKDTKIDCIISSPLKRALKKAEIIAEENCKVLIIDDRLIERDFGDYEGKTWNELIAFGVDPWQYNKDSIPNGESDDELFKRVSECLDFIKKKLNGKNVCSWRSVALHRLVF